MQKVTWLVALVLLLGATAMAQDTPKAEIFGGYSLLVADFSHSSFHLNGGSVSVTENVNSWFGGMLDFSTQFGTRSGFSVNSQQIMYGPVFAYRKASSVTPSAHVLLGAVRGSAGFLGISQPDTDFGLALGGGVDVKLTKIVSIRVIQADYLMTRFLSTHQNNIRASAGIVLNFGKK
jgi:opacity protein-like surface antigen